MATWLLCMCMILNKAHFYLVIWAFELYLGPLNVDEIVEKDKRLFGYFLFFLPIGS